MTQMLRKLFAEFLGTALLLAVVIGSGVMGERLAGGNAAIALLANTLATVGGLYVLIELFEPVSGAHFNPAVSLVMVLHGELPRFMLAPYIASQLVGAMLGAWLAHAMFGLSIVQTSGTLRTGMGQWLAEGVATFGLLLVILRAPAPRVAIMVAAYIGAAYWFTASTSFANPAAAFGRMWSNTFAGIAPSCVPAFVVAEFIGALVAVVVHRMLTPQLFLRRTAPRSHMADITIFHNPDCGTSRNTLALIRRAGIEPTVIEYLKTPPTKEKLRELVAGTRKSVRALLREKGTPYAELGLGDAKWTDDQLLDFIGQHPILMNRPLIVTPLGTKLCRPSETVLELLPVGKLSSFAKEDGEVIEDDGMRRG